MSHFYEHTEDGKVIARYDTPTRQAKKLGYFASVTTKLKFESSEALEGWKMKETIRQVEDNWRNNDESFEDYYKRINHQVWQPRKRWDGVEFASNDFGTYIHAELEKWNLDHDYQFAPEWEMYCYGWKEVYGRMIDRTIGAEELIACPLLKTAGSVDLIAEKDGMLSLWDYKARPHVKADGSPKELKSTVRDKDCQQLIIEADIIRRQRNLPYTPKCYSVIICTETGAYYVHEWTDYMMKKHLEGAIAINLAFNVRNGYQTLSEALQTHERVINGHKD